MCFYWVVLVSSIICCLPAAPSMWQCPRLSLLPLILMAVWFWSVPALAWCSFMGWLPLVTKGIAPPFMSIHIHAVRDTGPQRRARESGDWNLVPALPLACFGTRESPPNRNTTRYYLPLFLNDTAEVRSTWRSLPATEVPFVNWSLSPCIPAWWNKEGKELLNLLLFDDIDSFI